MRRDNEIESSIRKNLLRIMHEKGLSVSDISNKCGVGQSTIRNWLNGLTSPSAISLIRVCEALNANLLDITGETKRRCFECSYMFQRGMYCYCLKDVIRPDGTPRYVDGRNICCDQFKE